MMFKRVIKHEFKNMLRDKMYKFFAIYPFIFVGVALFLFPYLEQESDPIAFYIVVLVFILMNGFIYGAITGFTLLDDRDDNVLMSLKVSPIDIDLYVKIKLSLSYLFGMVSTVVLLIVADFFAIAGLGTVVMIVLLSPLQGPLLALLINAFATNKVEGFVIMKFAGLILMVPIAAIFLTDWKEIFLYIVPGFWSSRLILSDLMGIEHLLGSDIFYFLLGIIINVLCLMLLFKIYKKKRMIF